MAQPNGNQDGLQDHVPNEVYPCADGFVAITATSDDQWSHLATLLADSELTGLSTESQRRTERDKVNGAVSQWIANWDADAAVELLQSVGVPAGKVQTADDLINGDPQLAARGFWRNVTHAVFEGRTVDTFPSLWNGRRLPTYLLSPSYLGEHNFEVWSQLAGLDFGEVAEGVGEGLFA